MAGPLAAPLIGAASSLLGGLFNRSAQRKANEKNRPVNQVKEWEEAGINPLFGISSGGYIPHQAASIGDSFATAGGIFADHLARKEETDLRKTQMELENQRLKKELDKVANPSEPGHMEMYGGILPLPSNGGLNATNRKTAQVVRDADIPVRGNGSTHDVAPGREVEVAAYSSGPGLTEISNKYTDMIGGPIIVPGSDGEPWGVDEVATAFIAGTPQVGWRGYQNYIGEPFADWMMTIGDDHGVSKEFDYADEWGDSLPRSIKPTQQEIDDFNFRRSVIGG